MTKTVPSVPTLGSRGNVIGRPRKEPPPDCAQRIFTAAAEGRPVTGIAAVLKISRPTLNLWMDEHPDLREAFDSGREKERHELHSLMVRDARDGGKPNINAMFLLKARHGYREGDQGDQGNRVNVIFNMPGALSKEDYLKTVVATDA
jgi:hypothetical protein